jgi:hypothetical protein
VGQFCDNPLNYIFGARAVSHFGMHYSRQHRQVRFEQFIEWSFRRARILPINTPSSPGMVAIQFPDSRRREVYV